MGIVFALLLANGVSLGITTRFTLYVASMASVLVIIIRSMRADKNNDDLTTEIQRLKAADTHLRARMHYMLRDAASDVVAKSDDLIETPDLPYDEQRRLLASIHTTSHEIEQTLADISSSHGDVDYTAPHIRTSVLLGEELVSIVSTSPFSNRFTLQIERTRACGDPAKVRQILRTLVNHATLGEAETLTLQTAQRGSSVTATISGNGDILPPDALSALSDRGSDRSNSPGYRAIQLARVLAESLDGTISYLQVFGVGHVVLTLPAARTRHTPHTARIASSRPDIPHRPAAVESNAAVS